jgi:hypothetical protein
LTPSLRGSTFFLPLASGRKTPGARLVDGTYRIQIIKEGKK